jgi:hypothetical protein
MWFIRAGFSSGARFALSDPKERTTMEKISRRKFLYMGAATTAAAAVAACQPKTVIVEKTVKETVVVTEEKVVEKEVTKEVVVEREVTREIEVEKLITPTALPSNFGESPVDAQMVAEGKLAPVDERLPLEPLVIYPYDEIGQYGGQVRVASLGTSLLGGDGDMVNPPQQQLRITQPAGAGPEHPQGLVHGARFQVHHNVHAPRSQVE